MDHLLAEEMASEHPIVYDKQRGVLVLANTHQPYEGWDFRGFCSSHFSARQSTKRMYAADTTTWDQSISCWPL